MAKKLLIGILIGILLSLSLIYVGKVTDTSENTVVATEKATTSQSLDFSETTEESQKEESKNYPGNFTDWNLILVNEDNRIEEEPTNLVTLPNGYEIEARIEKEFNQLVQDGLEAGYQYTVISGYRSIAHQTQVVADEIARYQSQGMLENEAKVAAMRYVTEPGLSEHHTGLALDVLDTEWYNQGRMLEEAYGDTDAGKWLATHANDYGFVIRYPEGKETITGINYEPWHLRYVGKENAVYMSENDLTLEEYIEKLKK